MSESVPCSSSPRPQLLAGPRQRTQCLCKNYKKLPFLGKKKAIPSYMLTWPDLEQAAKLKKETMGGFCPGALGQGMACINMYNTFGTCCS